MKTAERKQNLKMDLIAAAERAVAARGLAGLTRPAMAGAVTKRLWEIDDIADILEAWESTK